MRRRVDAGRRSVTVALVGCVAMVALGVAVASPTVATSGPLIVVAVSVERRRRDARRRALGLATMFPVVVDRLIHQLRSGRSLAQSCAVVLAHQSEDQTSSDLLASSGLQHCLQPMIDALGARRTLEEAAALLVGRPEVDVRLFGVTVHVLARNGGPAVPALQRLRHTLIGAVHARDQAAAHAGQALASAGLMIGSPILVAVVIGVLSKDVAQLYLFEAAGAVCVFVAASLSCVGWWWLGRDVARLERRIG